MASMLVISSCKKKEDPKTEPTKGTLTLNISGLEDLGSDYVYEGWLVVAGSPTAAGIFTVDADGKLSKNTFEIDKSTLDAATAYVLTIEPANDPDPSPSKVHILGGDFSGSSAEVTISHAAAIGTDFTGATGSYILATPTDGDPMTDELSGVWWLDLTSGTPMAALELPALPDGWQYEGWALINGTPVTTGKFMMADSSDFFAGYSGTAGAPPFPGEDFLMNGPAGLVFPTDLSDGLVVISVEPYPDNSEAPFLLKPLVGKVDATPMAHTKYLMDNKAQESNPSGTISR